MPLYLKHIGGGKAELKDEPAQTPGEGQVVVKVVMVAGNPVDLALAEGDKGIVGSTVGYDFAGFITALGPGVTKFKVGDHVAGFGGPNTGSFGEYCIGDEQSLFKIPEGMSDEEAAVLPSALVVTALALYHFLQLPVPGSTNVENQGVLIWGGSTTMGSMAVQFAKASGASPIVATASPKNFDYVKSLGATHVVDYNDPEAAKKVRELAGNKLTKGLDAASYGNSFKQASECFGETGGTLVLLNPDSSITRTDVKCEFLNSFLALGAPFTIFGYEIPAVPEIRKFIGHWFATVAQPMIDGKKLKPQRVRLIPGGLKGVEEGWGLYREGKVSGEKLVYRIADTPGVKA